ncbi:MAG: helix-turn-helix domain-containing protein, partial [Anaeroplasmataceae bacterium]|nr:helix-turn-helix domain-containing protein [Anaeroplasmataceae bacterium]
MFKDKLKEYRKNLGLSQEELGKKIFVSRSAVAKWEQGRGMPNDQSMDDLANLFEVSKEELYDYKDV